MQSYRGKVILQALMDPLALGSVDIGWPGTASLSADRSGAGECTGCISTGWEVGVLFVLFQNHLWGDVVVFSCILKVFWFMDDR